MSSKKFLESLECAVSTDLRHISMNPIALSCGHTICKQCLPHEANTDILCVHCGTHQKKPINQNESLAAQVLFESSIDQMYEYLVDKFGCALRRLQDNYFEENLQIKMDLLKNDIDVRLESLKSELDEMRNRLFTGLNLIEQEIKSNKYKDASSKDALSKFEITYKELIEYNKRTSSKSVDDFKIFQNSLKNLYDTSKRLLKNDYELNFDTSKFSFGVFEIGTIKFNAMWRNFHISFDNEKNLLRRELIPHLYLLMLPKCFIYKQRLNYNYRIDFNDAGTE